MKKNNFLAFTFVELIIVITILGVLSTVGFVIYSSYLEDSRDSTRISVATDMLKSMEVYKLKKILPKPSDAVILKGKSDKEYGVQGYAGYSLLNKIGYKEVGKDPLDDKYFTYQLNKDGKNFQLAVFLEKSQDNLAGYFLDKTYAIDYSERIPKVFGNELGILLQENNSPIQENFNLRTSGLNISNTTDDYKAVLNDKEIITGNWKKLIFLSEGAGKDCEDLYLKNPSLKGKSSDYYIFSGGTSKKVHCDMNY